MPSKNQEIPKRDPWRVQVRPKRHKTGGAKKSIQRFFGAVSAKRKTDNGGETEPFSKAVHVAFAQGLLLFFERTIGDRTLKREHQRLLFLRQELFFSLSAPWVPKRAPEDLIRALVGSPGMLRTLKKSFLEGSSKRRDFVIEIWSENGSLGGARSSILVGNYSVGAFCAFFEKV